MKKKKLTETELWFLVGEWCLEKRVSPFDDYWYKRAKSEILKEQKDANGYISNDQKRSK